jgi:hypothetical protein
MPGPEKSPTGDAGWLPAVRALARVTQK